MELASQIQRDASCRNVEVRRRLAQQRFASLSVEIGASNNVQAGPTPKNRIDSHAGWI